MSGGPAPPGVESLLVASWNRVGLLIGDSRLTEALRWEALRRVRNFYGELQDLIEGVGAPPAVEGNLRGQEGVAVPSWPVTERGPPAAFPKSAGLGCQAEAPAEEDKGREAAPDKEHKARSASPPEELKRKKKEKTSRKKDKDKKRKEKERSLETVTPPASPGREKEGEVIKVEPEPATEELLKEKESEEEEVELEGEECSSPAIPAGSRAPAASPEREETEKKKSRTPEVREKKSEKKSPRREHRRSCEDRDRERRRSRSRYSSRRRREKSRSRRRHSTGSRPPPEPELPPLQRPRLPTAPPPGRFDHPGGFYGYGTWNSKGVKRRQRNWDIRQYGTDPSRKAARVDGYHSQGGDYRGR